MVRTIEGDIIVADDDGEVLTDRDDDRVDADDEGVEILTDGGEDVRTCAKCDHEGTDVEDVTETWEEEEVVSRGRRHPQTGEYMNVKTRTRVRGYSIPLCQSCRVDEGHEPEPEPVTDGGRPPLSSFDHARPSARRTSTSAGNVVDTPRTPSTTPPNVPASNQ